MNNDLVRREDRTPEKAEARKTATPAVDIYENGDEILLVADMPGVAKDGISVRLEQDTLTFEGRWVPGEKKGVLSREFLPLDYARSFALPSGINGDKIVATMDTGVLRVHLPKSAALKPRKIDIKVR